MHLAGGVITGRPRPICDVRVARGPAVPWEGPGPVDASRPGPPPDAHLPASPPSPRSGRDFSL